ncbi:MAG: 3'(2'),5'-bisphosphate nucleotidase CysQ family protein [Planctomycetota bacterium]|jgi:3'(2'), 5'-bisphosphate nucleotidase
MEQKILKELLDAAKEIAVAAGEAILNVSSEELDVNTKEDGSPLTRADTASHNTIESGLMQLEPILPIISEEGNLKEVSMENLETYWLIDPLDGTKEFVKGLDEYTVNIALIENTNPILGVIYVPVSKTLYYAAKGLGAWKAESGSEAKRIHASENESPKRAVVSRSHLSEETELFLNRIGIKEVIRHGSSLKMCAVALSTIRTDMSVGYRCRHGYCNRNRL